MAGSELGGRRARLMFAVLVLERAHPVAREVLAAALWGDELPSTWKPSLREVASKVRAALAGPGEPLAALVHEAGCYSLRVDGAVAVDVEIAEQALEQARALLGANPTRAAHLAAEAVAVGERPFLPGETGGWAEERRAALRDIHVGGWELIARAHWARGDPAAAGHAAEAAARAEPLRESAHVLHLQALTAVGQRARAIEVHDAFRRRLHETLGVLPSAETQAVYLAIIGDERRSAAVPLPGPATLAPPVALALPVALASPARVPFVGRAQARATLARAWSSVGDGRRGVVLLSGEAGVGKSRLAAELAAEVHAGGAVVLHGAAPRARGAPFAPLTQALEPLVDGLPQGVLHRHARAHGPALARILPGLGARLPDLVAPPQLDPESERHQLLVAIAGLLAAAGREQPLLLVMDDLQWADRSTLAALRHLVTATDPARQLLLAAHRPADPDAPAELGELLAACDEQDHVVRVALGPLDVEDVEGLVAADRRAGAPASQPSLARRLHAHTGGNAFFLVELLRDLTRAGVVAQRSSGRYVALGHVEDVAPSRDVLEVVAQRVRRLGELASGLLTVAALCGDEVSAALLADVTGEPPDVVADVLETAAAAGLLAGRRTAKDRVRFAHPLVAQALAQGLPPDQRTRLHGRIADALEQGGPAVHPAAVATHRVAALPWGDRALARRHAAVAGRLALADLAPDEALRWFETAADLLDDDAAATERIDVLVGLGEARRRTRGRGWRRTLLEAGRLALEIGDAQRLATAVLANTRGWYATLGQVDAERIELLDAAEQRVPATDPRRALVLALLAAERLFDGDATTRMTLCDEALGLARRSGDPGSLAQVLALRATATWVPWTLDARLAEARQLEELADRLEDPTLRFWGAVWNVVARGQANDGPGAREALERLRAMPPPQPRFEALRMFLDASWKIVEGDLDGAERLAQDALALGSAFDEVDARGYYGALVMGIRAAQGRLEELVQVLAAVHAAMPRAALVTAMLALAQVRSGDDAAARALLDAQAAAGFHVPAEPSTLATLVTWAQTVVALGAAEHADVLLQTLDAHRDQHVLLVTASYGSVGHAAARLHALAGRLEVADERYAAAIADLDALGARGFAATARAEHAELRAARPAAGRGSSGTASSLLRL